MHAATSPLESLLRGQRKVDLPCSCINFRRFHAAATAHWWSTSKRTHWHSFLEPQLFKIHILNRIHVGHGTSTAVSDEFPEVAATSLTSHMHESWTKDGVKGCSQKDNCFWHQSSNWYIGGKHVLQGCRLIHFAKVLSRPHPPPFDMASAKSRIDGLRQKNHRIVDRTNHRFLKCHGHELDMQISKLRDGSK